MISAQIVRRGLTILIVAPLVLFGISTLWGAAIVVWFLTFIGMLEWTAMKRHLKVALLNEELPLSDEYTVPAAKTNVFILVKCFACSMVCVAAATSESMYYFSMNLYFLFWGIFMLVGQNKAETNAEDARKKIGSPVSKTSTSGFHQMELRIIAERSTTELFLNFCLEYFGFVWVMSLTQSLVLYRFPVHGRPLVYMVLVSNWSNDVSALIAGKSLKGHTHALYPRISPNKTIEGALAGIVANGFSAAFVMYLFGYTSETLKFFAAGLVLGVLGVVGDLLESLFKRTAKLKDTGTVFPGHGGVLDRIDGLLIVFPATYWGLVLFFWAVG